MRDLCSFSVSSTPSSSPLSSLLSSSRHFCCSLFYLFFISLFLSLPSFSLFPSSCSSLCPSCILPLSLSLSLPFPSPVSGLIEDLSISSDRRPAFHIESFGYEKNGIFQIHIQQLNIQDEHTTSITERQETEVEEKKETDDSTSDAATAVDSNSPVQLQSVSGDAAKVQEMDVAFVLQRSNMDASVPLDQIQSSSTSGSGSGQGKRNGKDGKGGSNTGTVSCFHQSKVNAEDDVIGLPSLSSTGKEVTYVFSKTIDAPGYYHFYFSNCRSHTLSNFDLHLTQYNVVPLRNGQQTIYYLSAGEYNLPTYYFLTFLCFLLATLAWSSLVYHQHDNVKSIHYLMLLCIIVKSLSLLFQSLKYQNLKASGLHDGWFIAYDIFAVMKGMLLFSVIVLLGTGWSYLKPFLTERDRKIIYTVLIVQAFVNVAMIIVDENQQGSEEYLTWLDIFHLLDMLCCCATLLPIVWSIRHLREAAQAEHGKEQRATKNMERLTAFRSFYLATVSFVYFTRIIVYLLSSTLPFEWTWLSRVFNELASLIFYVITGYLFRPRPVNPYLPLDTDAMELEPLGSQDKRAAPEVEQL